MRYREKDINIPDWISEHTYYAGKDSSRTYISNEKQHTFLQLDGVSSDFWYNLLHSDSFEDFIVWVKSKNLMDFADDFIDELSGYGLVLLNNSESKKNEIAIKEYLNDDSENSNFVAERNKWLVENNFLANVFFELTYRCNLRCVHCYNPKDMSNIEIPFDKVKEIIDDAYDLGCFSVTLSGGESTLHSKFADIVEYIRSKRMSLEIFTNGQLLAKDSDLYKSICSCFPYRVGLSLYSTDGYEHEMVTNTVGSFDNTMSVIKKLRNDNINVQIKNFLLNINCDGCFGVKKLAEKIGASVVPDLSLIPTIEGNKKTFQYVVDEKALFRLYTDPQSPLYIGLDTITYDVEKSKDLSLCLGGFTSLCITPTLDVNVCVSMPRPVGNINEASLKEIWNGAIHKDMSSKLYEWQKLTKSDLKECYTKDYCKFCNYCAGMGYLENGFLEKSDILCIQARTKQRAYNSIKQKENK